MLFQSSSYTDALLAAAEAVHGRGPQDRRHPVVLFELGRSKRDRGYAVALHPEFRGIADTVASARAAGREEVLDEDHQHVKAIAVLGAEGEGYELSAAWVARRPGTVSPSGRRQAVVGLAERIVRYAEHLLAPPAGVVSQRWRAEQIKKSAKAIVDIAKGAQP